MLARILPACMFLCVLWVPFPVWAVTNIAIVVSAPSATSNEFIEQFKTEMMQGSGAKPILNIIDVGDLANNRVSINENMIVLAVGVQALYQASKLDNKPPVLGVMVPQTLFSKLLQISKRNPRNFSAITLDQPISRQIALVKTIMPNATHISVLLGPVSINLASELQRVASQQGLGLLQERIDDPADIIHKLKRVLEASPVLLAVPDPIVYNNETAQTILLTSYRYMKPVIGFSHAYVRAGALAAVFSSPSQIAKQAGEVIREFSTKPQLGLPPPLAPKYFSIDTNRQVARSLGIELSDENALSERLLQMEGLLP